MLVRLIIAKIYHDRMREFAELVRDKWGPMLEAHGGKFLGVFKNTEPGTHEVVGMMRFDNHEHMEKVLSELAKDERFQILNQKMRPMLQSNEVRLVEPL